MASPLDPDASGVIGWALSGIGVMISGAVAYLYRRLRRLTEIETGQIVEAGLIDFETKRIMPLLNRLEGRISNVEKLENSLVAIRTNVEHLAEKVGDLHDTVEKNAEESTRQLTGAMNRLSDQRKEDMQIQLERADNLKELIEAKIK